MLEPVRRCGWLHHVKTDRFRSITERNRLFSAGASDSDRRGRGRSDHHDGDRPYCGARQAPSGAGAQRKVEINSGRDVSSVWALDAASLACLDARATANTGISPLRRIKRASGRDDRVWGGLRRAVELCSIPHPLQKAQRVGHPELRSTRMDGAVWAPASLPPWREACLGLKSCSYPPMRPEVKASGYLIVPGRKRENTGISPLRRMIKPFCSGRDDWVWGGWRRAVASRYPTLSQRA